MESSAAKIIFIFGLITLLVTVYNAYSFFTNYDIIHRLSPTIADQYVLNVILWLGVAAAEFALVQLLNENEKQKLMEGIKK